MYRVEVNTQNNTLEIHFTEYFDEEQGEKLISQLSARLCNLKPGFKLLTDLSQLRHMDLEAHSSIDSIMELCNKHGVSKVVRVITRNTSDIGFNITSLFHYSHRVIIHTCESLSEAQKEMEVF